MKISGNVYFIITIMKISFNKFQYSFEKRKINREKGCERQNHNFRQIVKFQLPRNRAAEE